MLRGPVRKVARFIYRELNEAPHTPNNATHAGAKKQKKTKNHTAESLSKNKKKQNIPQKKQIKTGGQKNRKKQKTKTEKNRKKQKKTKKNKQKQKTKNPAEKTFFP